MNILSNIFYGLSLVFIIFEFFQIFNRNRIYQKIDISNIKITTSLIYILVYITKLIYLIWMFVGLFSDQYVLFMLLILTGLIKNIIFIFKSNILINVYDIINLLVSCYLLFTIFIRVFFLL